MTVEWGEEYCDHKIAASMLSCKIIGVRQAWSGWLSAQVIPLGKSFDTTPQTECQTSPNGNYRVFSFHLMQEIITPDVACS